jgi:hypothetical protein
MKHINRSILVGAFSLLFCLSQSASFAQKKASPPKLDKRRYDIEIRETTTEGKKFEKDVFEFTPREIISDYFELKLKVPTLHYKVVKDSTFTDEGDQVKYWKLSIQEKGGKGEEEYVAEVVVSGREINGKIKLMKGDAVKKTYEFEGTQNN